jgi:hypothetical protein
MGVHPTLRWLEMADRGTRGAIKLTPLDAAPEPRNLRRLKKGDRGEQDWRLSGSQRRWQPAGQRDRHSPPSLRTDTIRPYGVVVPVNSQQVPSSGLTPSLNGVREGSDQVPT